MPRDEASLSANRIQSRKQQEWEALSAEEKQALSEQMANTTPLRPSENITATNASQSDAAKKQWRLVTVNTAPERAKRLIGRVVEDLKDQFDIVHVANADSIDQVEPLVKEHQPNVLFCASMWTPEESSQIQTIARNIVPGIKTHAIPQGLQVERGPDAIVEYLDEQIPKLLA